MGPADRSVARNLTGDVACAVVDAPKIVGAAAIPKVGFESGLAIEPGVVADFESGGARELDRLDLHQAGRKFRRQIRRVGLQDLDAVEEVRGEHVEGNHAPLRLCRGQERVVECRGAVAFAESPDVDELVFDDRDAGYLLQRAGRVRGRAGSDLLAADGVRDSLRELPLDNHRFRCRGAGRHRFGDFDLCYFPRSGEHGAGVGDLARDDFQTLDIDRKVVVRGVFDGVDSCRRFDSEGAIEVGDGLERHGPLGRHFYLRNHVARGGVVHRAGDQARFLRL